MCEVETLCLIYGIFNLLTTSLGLVGTVGGIIYVNVMLAHLDHDLQLLQGVADFAAAAVSSTLNVVLGAMLCVLLIPFAFSIVLVKGIAQKKATYVKVYFCYSVITKSLVLLGVLIAVFAGQIHWLSVLIVAILCALNGLVLWMIFLTYKKIKCTKYDRSNPIQQKY